MVYAAGRIRLVVRSCTTACSRYQSGAGSDEFCRVRVAFSPHDRDDQSNASHSEAPLAVVPHVDRHPRPPARSARTSSAPRPTPRSPAERLQHPVCDWSQAQLGGYGREHFDTVEDAMRRVGVPVEAHDAIVAALRFVEFDEVFVVHSLTYGALAAGGRTVAGFGKTYYWVGDRRVNLPSYVDSARSGHTTAGAHGEICPVHFVAMNLLGVCDDC